jgi:hypothetical protein
MKQYKGLNGNTLIIESYDIIIWWGLFCAICGGFLGYGIAMAVNHVEKVIGG